MQEKRKKREKQFDMRSTDRDYHVLGPQGVVHSVTRNEGLENLGSASQTAAPLPGNCDNQRLDVCEPGRPLESASVTAI